MIDQDYVFCGGAQFLVMLAWSGRPKERTNGDDCQNSGSDCNPRNSACVLTTDGSDSIPGTNSWKSASTFVVLVRLEMGSFQVVDVLELLVCLPRAQLTRTLLQASKFRQAKLCEREHRRDTWPNWASCRNSRTSGSSH